jgi:sulfane dehydrogenase subunit SoxC
MGPWEIRGLAWSGRGRIARVEVSTDGGKSWNEAALDDPVLPQSHTRFRYPWIWDGQEAILTSRATDETVYVQCAAHARRVGRGTGDDVAVSEQQPAELESGGDQPAHA